MHVTSAPREKKLRRVTKESGVLDHLEAPEALFGPFFGFLCEEGVLNSASTVMYDEKKLPLSGQTLPLKLLQKHSLIREEI